jgi:cell division protein FtsL
MATTNNKILTEWMWKVFTVVLGVLILPLAGWVWNMNVSVAQLQNDLGDVEETIAFLEQKVEEAERNSRAIISIEKDIEYMRGTLDRIEMLITE